MNWIREHRRSAWLIGLTLVVPVVFYCDALLGLIALRQGYQDEIDNIEPRIARLQGLAAFENQLRASSGQVDAQLLRLFYPVTADRATASAALQNDVRQMLVEAGLSVSNSQVLPVREKERFDYLGLKVTVAGDVASLDTALANIAAQQPALIVESLEIWPNRQSPRKGAAVEQVVTASLQLLSLRAVE